jgi:hypothetical protein
VSESDLQQAAIKQQAYLEAQTDTGTIAPFPKNHEESQNG